jgi:hypothetical protein
MAKDLIGYDNLVDQALRSVVRGALLRVQKQGLIGSHHFYLTFKTHDAGVEIPDFLRERYPDEMTIVLQNQYSGLKVNDEDFEVTLTFQKLPCTLVVPFAAMTAFADPGVQFGLQFKNASAATQQGAPAEGKPSTPMPSPAQRLKTETLPSPGAREQTSTPAEKGETPQIVSLDKFRKK